MITAADGSPSIGGQADGVGGRPAISNPRQVRKPGVAHARAAMKRAR